MYRTSKNKLAKRVGVSTIIAAGAIASGVGIAGASAQASPKAPSVKASTVATSASSTGAKQARSATLPAMMGRSGGTITALSSSSITILTPRGTSTTFRIDSSTAVTKDRLAATFADLAIGEHVRIMTSSTSATDAARIEIELARVAGTVVSVSGNKITVSDRDGLYRTITVGASTTYTKGAASASLSDVTSGTFIMAEGAVDANHTSLDASAVGIGQPSAPSASGTTLAPGMYPQGMGGPGKGGPGMGDGFGPAGARFN